MDGWKEIDKANHTLSKPLEESFASSFQAAHAEEEASPSGGEKLLRRSAA
jgi:hypothetical protein